MKNYLFAVLMFFVNFDLFARTSSFDDILSCHFSSLSYLKSAPNAARVSSELFELLLDGIHVQISKDHPTVEGAVFVGENAVGIRSPIFNFTYNGSKRELGFINKMRKVELSDTRLKFLDDIHVSGKSLSYWFESESEIYVEDFKLNCGRDRLYPEIGEMGFVAGCLGKARGEIGQFQLKKLSLVDFNGEIRNIQVDQQQIKIESPSLVFANDSELTKFHDIEVILAKGPWSVEMTTADFLHGIVNHSEFSFKKITDTKDRDLAIDFPGAPDGLSSIRKVKMELKAGELTITGKYNLIAGLPFKVKGNAHYHEKGKEFKIKIKKGRILGIFPAKSLLLYILRKVFKETGLEINGDEIIISTRNL